MLRMRGQDTRTLILSQPNINNNMSTVALGASNEGATGSRCRSIYVRTAETNPAKESNKKYFMFTLTSYF